MEQFTEESGCIGARLFPWVRRGKAASEESSWHQHRVVLRPAWVWTRHCCCLLVAVIHLFPPKMSFGVVQKGLWIGSPAFYCFLWTATSLSWNTLMVMLIYPLALDFCSADFSLNLTMNAGACCLLSPFSSAFPLFPLFASSASSPSFASSASSPSFASSHSQVGSA